MNETFIYKMNNNFEYEAIITENEEMNRIYDYSTKYYKLPLSSKELKFQAYQRLGNFTLYLLGNLDKDSTFNNNIKMQHLKTYLIKCINDEKYCNNKIFLAFTRDILHIQNLPSCKCFASNYYSEELLNNNFTEFSIEERMQNIYDSLNNITLEKEYFCNSIIELLVASMYEIFSKGYKIKKCRSCNKFFVARGSTVFCSYISPLNENISCLEYSRGTSYVEKRRKDPIQNKYAKICNMLKKRKEDIALFHPNEKEKIKQCENDYDTFRKLYKEDKKIQFKKGEISQEDLLSFLIEKEIYYKNKKKEERKNGGSRTNKK